MGELEEIEFAEENGAGVIHAFGNGGFVAGNQSAVTLEPLVVRMPWWRRCLWGRRGAVEGAFVMTGSDFGFRLRCWRALRRLRE